MTTAELIFKLWPVITGFIIQLVGVVYYIVQNRNMGVSNTLKIKEVVAQIAAQEKSINALNINQAEVNAKLDENNRTLIELKVVSAKIFEKLEELTSAVVALQTQRKNK